MYSVINYENHTIFKKLTGAHTSDLFRACLSGDLGLVTDLADQDAINHIQNIHQGNTLLHDLINSQVTLDVIRILAPFDCGLKNSHGDTCLHLVCKLNLTSYTPYFNHRISISVKNEKGFTPLMIACQNGNLEIVKVLLTNRNLNLQTRTESGDTVFDIACQNNYDKILSYLLAYSHRELQLKIPDKPTQLIHNMIECNNKKPEKFRRDLQRILKLDADFASQVFAVILYHCDDYLSFGERISAQTGRFFKITKQLPMELQMLICNLQYRRKKIFIPKKDLESALRKMQ